MNSYLKIILGNVLITIAYAFITVPNKIINGGTTAFAMILSQITNINTSFYTSLITLMFILLGYYFLGKQFVYKSLLSSLSYSTFFYIFDSFKIGILKFLPITLTIAAIMSSLGYLLCITAGSSTVGFDVIALILNNRNPRFEVSKTLRAINITIILMGAFTHGIRSVLLGLIFTYLHTSLLHLGLKNYYSENNKTID